MAVTGAVDMASRAWRSGTGDKESRAPPTHRASSQRVWEETVSPRAEEKQQKERAASEHREGDGVRPQLLSGWSRGGGGESYPEHHRILTVRHFFLLTAGRAVEGEGEVTGTRQEETLLWDTCHWGRSGRPPLCSA